MSNPIPRALTWAQALLFPFALLPFLIIRPASALPPQRRTDRSRPRPYLPSPAVPPDYDRFCEVHTRHRALWRLTYVPGQQVPYQAHHRYLDGIALAAADLDALDFALAHFAPPPRTRPYVDERDRPEHPNNHDHRANPSSSAPARAEHARTLGLREVRCLHQLADDLMASTHGRCYWTSAVRDAALEILTRIAALIGGTCGQRAPGPARSAEPAEPAPPPPGTPPRRRRSCVRPADHEGHHLDASGRSWHNAEEGSR
ncbi:hypothetical protein F4561_005730 [Lipingzhangella halophila]|uniref:Uncharacterized protein n=1 Tax=Lipingzhangella halophila TaxID=1783352 RepID=A0A7W7RMS7_9ACTN|nr:hypothetical protein [Lipingzhangella halophila]MBB4934836.1 hypothetical protein [Lipingzhangella halophila]